MPRRPNLLFVDRPHHSFLTGAQKLGFSITEAYQQPLESLMPELAQAFGIIMRSRFNVSQPFLSHCPQLRFIARMGIGLEHIDLNAAAEAGVRILNSPEGSRDTVAEQVIGMILGLLNHIGKADREIRNGIWDRKRNLGYELRHRTVGIIGFGNIGTAVAARLSSFGCRVLAYDKYKKGFGGRLAAEVSLEQLQEEADVVTLHIPYDASNHYFAGEAFFQSFQKPFFLINAARGLVLDTAALADAMKAGQVMGAGLDVLEYEEQAFNELDLNALPEPFQYLRQSPFVLMTPHTGGHSHEVMEAHSQVLLRKIAAAFPL